MADSDATRSAPADRVTDRVMQGETPLQALARQGELPATRMRSIERFPYYTAFPFAWYRACHSDEVPSGGLRPLRLLSRDLVVWRGEDGEAHVMDAYCPHLGAHLGYGGRVEGCELVCPFHWWRFGADGRNTCIPYDGSTSPAARIETYPTIDRNGMILFWYHPRRVAPLWEIPRIEQYYDDGWTDYTRAEWTIRAPWQEFAEHGPDFVHLRTVYAARTCRTPMAVTSSAWTAGSSSPRASRTSTSPSRSTWQRRSDDHQSEAHPSEGVG